MNLLVGLGNPGKDYAGNRHNAGFMVLDALVGEDAFSLNKKFAAEVAEILVPAMQEGKKGGQQADPALSVSEANSPSRRPVGRSGDKTKVILIKPQTYMNLSGQSVQAAMQFYKVKPAQVTVIHDDLDIPLGEVRIKTGGGHGGHNGLRDIDRHIGKDYQRIRLGIGHPGQKHLVSPYVLSNFPQAERAAMEEVIAGLLPKLPEILA